MSENQTKRLGASFDRRFALSAISGCTSLLIMVGLSDVSFERVPAESSGRSIRFADKFERGQLNAWQMPYRKDWEILAENGNHHLHMKRNREPLVPRRPVQFVLVKGVNAGSFDLRLRGRRQGRSMIVVFNYVGTLHFYYTHLSEDRGRKQVVHKGIFLVNSAPRVRIAGLDAPPALPDTSWHDPGAA